ncbi:RNA polymerase sigma-70 factor, ECF subfamily [Shimia gijangensis]|uniref:RNA polymerase sigma-70 factor, ECF subfamily n=1 Tax=Shimia gijangensis TaxID=1470563 RepID=A0A1M6HME3_9RHOB|nr:sigma-70 family RNA polymerase sigma factor [Shimia gijangensis]SHJ23352.1 RNA polymerase sigma-70 factor, ECF subfamily [Shimia gijangensis]
MCHNEISPPEVLVGILPKLRRRALRLCESPDVADDLTQETVLRIWSRLISGDEITDIQAYGMTVMRNLAFQNWRDRKPTVDIEDIVLATPARATGHLACRDALSAVSRLPAGQAEVMTLITIEGHTAPEAAQEIGLPLGTVNSRLARARSRLRSEIGLEKDKSIVTLLD